MTPLERAIFICGTQSELARLVVGKPATGHVYHWRQNGCSEDVAISIERAQLACVAENSDADERARSIGGIATVEMLRPDRVWSRDEKGVITSYAVPIEQVA